MEFLIADSLTGTVVGQIYPSSWEITEPLVTASTGNFTVALPTDAGQVANLRSLTTPRRRMVVVVDDQDGCIFGGPILKRPKVSGQTIVVPVVDWRSWFYHAYIRPTAGGSRRNYIKQKTKKGDRRVEQTKAMTDLARLALDTIGKPAITIDSVKSSNIKRSIGARMLDRSIGDYLDNIQARSRGCEWWTYCTVDRDRTKVITHFAVAYPERRLSADPVNLQHRIATARRPGGGTVTGFDIGDPEAINTRVWAMGEGSPPKQKWAKSETSALRKKTDLSWEDVVSSDAKAKAEVYDSARKQINGQANRGTVDFTVTAERIPLSSIGPGDRARVDLDDGWNKIVAYSARITQRVMSGGTGKATTQTLTVNLDDNRTPDDPTLTPGYPVQ